MKKLYTLFFALLLAGNLAAQNPTAYFMEGSTFRTSSTRPSPRSAATSISRA